MMDDDQVTDDQVTDDQVTEFTSHFVQHWSIQETTAAADAWTRTPSSSHHHCTRIWKL